MTFPNMKENKPKVMLEDTSIDKRSFSRQIERSDWKQHLDSHRTLISEFERFLEPFQLPLFVDKFIGILRFHCFEVAGAKSSLEKIQVEFEAPNYFDVEVAFKNSATVIDRKYRFALADILAWSISSEPLLQTKRLEIDLLLPSDEPEIINLIEDPNVWKMRGERYSPLANIHSTYQNEERQIPWYKYHFGLKMPQNKKPIGFISFYQISQPELVTPLISQTPYETVMLSYALAKTYWGRGLMSESLSACVPWFVANQSVRELVGFADINNRGSRRLLQKLGLQDCGLLPDPKIGADLKDKYQFIIYKKRYPDVS